MNRSGYFRIPYSKLQPESQHNRQYREEIVTGIRKLTWASWFIGTGLVLLSWLGLVSTDVGWYGTYIAAAGWLLSLATSSSPFVKSNTSDGPPDRNHRTVDECRVAILNLTRRLEKSPRDRTELLAARGAYHRELGNWDEAIADLDAAVGCNTDVHADVYFNRAIVLLESGAPDRAIVDINKAINCYQSVDYAGSNYESARLCRHDILLELECFKTVIDDCDDMLAGQVVDVLDLDVRITRGIALSAIGRNTDSLDELDEVISKLDDKDGQILCRALSARADASLRLGNAEQALTDIRRLQTLQGLTTHNLNLMGIAETQLKNFRAALNCYQKGASLAPSDVEPYLQLALIQAGCPEARFRDGTQAEANARKACELSKWNVWNCISVLAAAKAELGEFDQAVEFAKQAHRLAPDREKEDRQKRVEQFRNGEPFRIDDTPPRTIHQRNSSES